MYRLNDIIIVTVTSIKDYGVFVKTDSDYTGLIHISEINGDYIRNIKSYFKNMTTFKARIIGIDEENKHLSLSMKNLNSNVSKTYNNLKEVGEGFDLLKDKLPEWIDEAKKSIENSK